MSNETGRIHVSFADVNESAYVLREVFRTYDDDSSVEWQTAGSFDERINMLLDLFRYAELGRR